MGNGGTVIVDDAAGRAAGMRFGIPAIGSLALIVDRMRMDAIDRDAAAEFVDALLATGMRLPLQGGSELVVWAYENGLLP